MSFLSEGPLGSCSMLSCVVKQGTGEVLSLSRMRLHVCYLPSESPPQAIRALELNELRRVASEQCHIALTDSIVIHTVVNSRPWRSIHRGISHPKRAKCGYWSHQLY